MTQPSQMEWPGRVDLPCPACREVVPLWIERADLRIDRWAGGLGGEVTVAGAHACAAVEKGSS